MGDIFGLKTFDEQKVAALVRRFCVNGTFSSFSPNGRGNVNDTLVVEMKSEGQVKRFTLQRINHSVFEDPIRLMENFSRVTRHLQSKPNQNCLQLVSSKDGKFFHLDEDGNFWRMLHYVEGVICLNVPETTSQAYEAARTFGQFQVDLSDLPGSPLHETIPNFHNTSQRYQNFLKSTEADPLNRLNSARDLYQFVLSRKDICEAVATEKYPLRVVHNDTKLNNVLLDNKSGKGVCVIDLDTVMPGCVLHDFGDLVRTASCTSHEEEKDLNKISFDYEIFKSIVRGYLESTHKMLESIEVAGLALAPLAITYELGIRFLTDYIDGDLYFKTNHPQQNLERAKVQFKLLESMENESLIMEEIVRNQWKTLERKKNSFSC